MKKKSKFRQNLHLFTSAVKGMTIDWGGLINGTSTFLLAWTFVFYYFQIFTFIPALALGVKMKVSPLEIDFNYVNTTANDINFWTDTDNIINIFGTPAIMLFLLVMVSLILFMRRNFKRLNVRRFFFWLVVCGAIRLTGNYVSGSLFGRSYNIWNWNLVTDFLGLTTNNILQVTFILFILIITYWYFHSATENIKCLLDPFSNNRIDKLVSTILLPVVVASVIIIAWYRENLPLTEYVCLAMMMLFIVIETCNHFISRYKGIRVGNDIEAKEKLAVTPLVLAILIAGVEALLYGKNFVVQSSQYKRVLVEEILLGIIISSIIFMLIVFIVNVRRDRKVKAKRLLRKTVEANKNFEASNADDVLQEFGVQKIKDIDKYKQMWKDAEK